jgi:hypothetical protein
MSSDYEGDMGGSVEVLLGVSDGEGRPMFRLSDILDFVIARDEVRAMRALPAGESECAPTDRPVSSETLASPGVTRRDTVCLPTLRPIAA